jgi:hypothetical protein
MASKFIEQLSPFRRYLYLRILNKCRHFFELRRLSSGFVLYGGILVRQNVMYQGFLFRALK